MANMKQHKLGWIGIGRMGYAMAERLAKAGCDITVWNRTREKAEPLAKSGAKIAGSLAERKFTALYGRAGRLVGVLTFSRPRDLAKYRRMIATRTSLESALAAAGN